jgi:hypothetical protein
MVTYQTIPIRIPDQLQQGISLAIQPATNSPPERFVVDNIEITHNRAAGEQPRYTLTHDRPDGTEWSVTFHHGATAAMIVDDEDDEDVAVVGDDEDNRYEDDDEYEDGGAW